MEPASKKKKKKKKKVPSTKWSSVKQSVLLNMHRATALMSSLGLREERERTGQIHCGVCVCVFHKTHMTVTGWMARWSAWAKTEQWWAQQQQQKTQQHQNESYCATHSIASDSGRKARPKPQPKAGGWADSIMVIKENGGFRLHLYLIGRCIISSDSPQKHILGSEEDGFIMPAEDNTQNLVRKQHYWYIGNWCNSSLGLKIETKCDGVEEEEEEDRELRRGCGSECTRHKRVTNSFEGQCVGSCKYDGTLQTSKTRRRKKNTWSYRTHEFHEK